MMRNAYDLFFTTLANMNRLMIINTIRNKELNVTEICKHSQLNQTTVSHNLKRLLECGFVFVNQRGKNRFYSLNKDTIKPLMNLIDHHVKNYCSKIVRR